MVRRSSVVFALVAGCVLAVFFARAADAQVSEGSCASHVSGDFDGDGNSDLAVGVPGEDVNSRANAGAVHIIRGDNPGGLTSTDDVLFTQDSAGMSDGSEAGDAFGSCLAAGDFNGDGESDLAIGIPGEDFAGEHDVGAVAIIYGAVDGLDPFGPPTDDFLHQATSGVPGTPETEDGFGSALAAGDFSGDGRDDLAIGVPFDDVIDIIDAGAVDVLYGAPGGVTTSGAQLFHQNRNGAEEVPERQDEFGSSLAAGTIDGDGRADLAVGVPGEAIGSVRGAGAVQVLYSPGGRLGTSRDVVWHQNRSGVLDASELHDRFGTAVAVADFDSDGSGDLAVGVPKEDVGSAANAGAVNVFYGSDTGVTAAADDFVTENTTAPADIAVSDDLFGSSLAAADVEDDGVDDLMIGAPGEDTGGADAGAVEIVPGVDSTGLNPAAAYRFTQAVLLDSEEAADAFASSLAAGDFNGDGFVDLAIGVPFEDLGSQLDAGAVNVVYGTNLGLDPAGPPADQFWRQGGGVLADEARSGDRFGAALG